MGTNYYVAENVCECCKRYDEQYHIGKSSYGWAFTFQGYKWKNLTSWKAWKEFLKDKIIMDEYSERILYEDFVAMVETVKAPGYKNKNGHKNLIHNQEIDFNPECDWDDDLGYSFTLREFS